MIERFSGDSGRAALVEELGRQVVVNGDAGLAEIFADSIELIELEADEVLIEQHGEDNSLYFILTGGVSIEVNGEVIANRLAGTHVGEMALVDRRAVRSASCKVTTKAVVAVVTESDFSAIADDYPKLWRRIAIELSERLYGRNKLVRKSIPFSQFLIDEFLLYIATMVVVFMYAVFKTNTLQDEKALVVFVVQRINSDTMIELALLLFAILVVIGILQILRQMTGSERVEGCVREFQHEVPRAIYFMGASLSGALFAVVVFVHQSENSGSLAYSYATLAIIFSAMIFFLGFIISFFLKRKEKKIQPIQWLC